MPRTRSAQGDLPPITRRGVLDAAIAVVRAEGVDALSVRRVASDLGVWPTTIYHHVGGTKEGLLALTLDELAATLRLPEVDDRPWREMLVEFAWELHRALLPYPGVAAHLLTAPAPGPHAQQIMERVLRVLVERAGLPVAEAFDVYRVLIGYVLLSSQQRQQESTLARIERYAELAADGGFPYTSRVPDAVSDGTVEERFAGGLRVVLDGIAARAEAGTGEASGR